MFDYKKFAQITKELPARMESDHFVVHYGLRNPRPGKGLGPGGVGDPVLVRWYLSALERLYRTLTSPPWKREPPLTNGSRKTQVYVCDLDQVGVRDPFTTADRERIPFIALSCRSDEPLTDAVMRRAAAEAIHEATHVFNARERPFHSRVDFRWWAWLNEALATFMESRVLPGNQDYFRFLSDWIDLPGIPLNDWRAAYQGCLFLHYLAGKVEPVFPNLVWVESDKRERPLQALQRLASARGYVFCSADPEQRDLFASGYAMDSYFLRDHTGGCFAPDLCTRFGDRAVVQSFDLTRGNSCTAAESLPHLANHYFRLFPRRGVEHVRFTLRSEIRDGTTPFKAEAAVVLSDLSRGPREVLRPVQEGDASGRNPLTAEISGLGEIDLHHLVLVVSNCTLQELPMDNPLPAGDSYEIEISTG